MIGRPLPDKPSVINLQVSETMCTVRPRKSPPKYKKALG